MNLGEDQVKGADPKSRAVIHIWGILGETTAVASSCSKNGFLLPHHPPGNIPSLLACLQQESCWFRLARIPLTLMFPLSEFPSSDPTPLLVYKSPLALVVVGTEPRSLLPYCNSS